MNNEIEIKKERSSNIELYRIVVMLLIVAHHSVVCSDVYEALPAAGFSLDAIGAYLLGMWGKTGINCFVLITGYFMCVSQITLRKFMKLLLEVLFYYVGIYLLFVLFGHCPFTLREMWLNCIPVQDINGGFTSAYLLFFLFIPFINACIQHVNQQQHAWLCVLNLLIYTIMPYVPGVTISMNYVVWFSVIYILGAYIRLHKDSVWKSDNVYVWGVLTAVSVLGAMASVVAIVWYNSLGHHVRPYMFVSDSNALLAVLVAVSSFIWVSNIQMKTSKMINRVAASAFGVLLIHSANGIERQWLWEDLLRMSENFHTPPCSDIKLSFCVYAMGCVCAIYIVCTGIDMLRIKWIETPLFSWFDKKWNRN